LQPGIKTIDANYRNKTNAFEFKYKKQEKCFEQVNFIGERIDSKELLLRRPLSFKAKDKHSVTLN
jgi:3-deoxy-D-manno-octulosonate 8-phosphate phosphatase KdsC-like HAD superfamily phosphatase